MLPPITNLASKTTTMKMTRIAAILLISITACASFTGQKVVHKALPIQDLCTFPLHAVNLPHEDETIVRPITVGPSEGRRQLFQDSARLLSVLGLAFLPAEQARADFTPGGTLVDREVGITVGNSQASTSRKVDNTNVLFMQDYYFKFGTAAPWIEPDSTEFPKSMPFVRAQDRYDALKKYGARIQNGLSQIASLKKATRTEIGDATAADVYQLRPMGLLANNLLASENTGSTNEQFLARYYINEILLLVNDMRSADSDDQALQIYPALQRATNSYLTLMNRVITEKVGDKFAYL
jgi:hypothetical protein